MDSLKMIPLHRHDDDPLRYGIHGVKSDIIKPHPLEAAYRSARSMKKKILANTYGAAFSMKMELDRQILSNGEMKNKWQKFESKGMMPPQKLQSSITYFLPVSTELRFQRPPGAIPSSFVGLEAFTGSTEDFGFEDYLNDPTESESYRPVDLHHGMEVRLGLSKGPPCPSFM